MERNSRQQILAFITEFIDTNGFAPTLREIAAGCGLHSTSAVRHHLRWLESFGVVQRRKGTARGIRLTKTDS